MLAAGDNNNSSSSRQRNTSALHFSRAEARFTTWINTHKPMCARIANMFSSVMHASRHASDEAPDPQGVEIQVGYQKALINCFIIYYYYYYYCLIIIYFY
jgi:hypothetical protein